MFSDKYEQAKEDGKEPTHTAENQEKGSNQIHSVRLLRLLQLPYRAASGGIAPADHP